MKKARVLWAGYSVLGHFNIPFFPVVLVTDGPEVTLDRILTFLCISRAAEIM